MFDDIPDLHQPHLHDKWETMRLQKSHDPCFIVLIVWKGPLNRMVMK